MRDFLHRSDTALPRAETASATLLRWAVSAPSTLVFCGGLLSLTLLFPFIEDNIPQAYIARRLLHGELPYVGTWDQNYPGVLLFHLLALTFSPSALAFRFVDLAFELWMVWVLFDLGTRVHSKAAGLFAALLYCLYYVLNGIDDLAGQKDVFASIALVTAVWLLVRSNYRSVNLAGLMTGIAVLIRPTYGLHLLVLATAILIITKDIRVKQTLIFTAFAAFPLLLFCVTYALAGHLHDFWEATFLFTTNVYNPHPRLGILKTPALYQGLIPPLTAGAVTALLAKKEKRREGWILLALFGASAGSSMLLWGYRYHYQSYMSFELFLAGIAIAYILLDLSAKYVKSETVRNAMVISLAILIVVFQLRGSTMSRLIRDSIRDGEISTASIDRHFAAGAYNPLGEQQLADYVVRHSKPGDRMESFYTTVYPQYCADLRPANRFILTIPLLMRNARGEFTDFQRRWQREYVDSLTRVRPRWFLISDPTDTAGIGEGGRLPRQMLHETFPEVEAMIEQNYHCDTSIGMWTLYARN